MTLELVDESDVIKEEGKEKKSEKKAEKYELRLVNDSELKKAGSNLEIIDESEVREHPNLKLISKPDKIKKEEGQKEGRTKRQGLELIEKEKVLVCERTAAGMTDNCAICRALNRDRFDRCPNKYGGS